MEKLVRRRKGLRILILPWRLLVLLAGLERFSRMPSASTQLVKAKPSRNRENPSGKLRRNLIPPRRLINAHENILRQILRLLEVVHHAIEQVDDRLLIFIHQRLKSLQVPVFHTEHQS